MLEVGDGVGGGESEEWLTGRRYLNMEELEEQRDRAAEERGEVALVKR
jgi:hypothetical protein